MLISNLAHVFGHFSRVSDNSQLPFESEVSVDVVKALLGTAVRHFKDPKFLQSPPGMLAFHHLHERQYSRLCGLIVIQSF